MPYENAYTCSNADLVDRLVRAAARSGRSNSGLVIDAAGPLFAADTFYLKGVVLARLERKKPPFEPEITVIPKQIPHHGYRFKEQITDKNPLKVERVFYAEECWYLEFQGHDGIFDASNYEAVNTLPAAA